MAALKVEVDVEVTGHFQPGFLERGKGGAVGQQLGFEHIPSGFGLGVVVGIARPAEAGQVPGLRNSDAAGGAGVLAALAGVDEKPWRGLTQRQGLFQGRQHEFGG